MKLKDVKIVNYNKTINNADVEIINNKIHKIIIKEGEGNSILIPGFIDIHTHGLYGHDFMDGKEAIEKITEAFAKFGVTSIFATIMTRDLETMEKSLIEISEVNSKGANILGIHSEGPFISLKKKGAHNPKELMKGNISILRQQYNASKGLLKKVTFAPEECSLEFIDAMIELGIMPSIGHTNGTFEQITEAIERGALQCTHLWNAMTGVINRNPGAAEAIIYDDRIYAELVVDFIHIDKDTLKFTLKNKKPEKIILVTDSIRPAGLPDGESKSGGIIIVKKGLKIVLKGTDVIAGSGATMHDCFKDVLILGVTINEAVMMSSYNAAKSLNLHGKGIIQEGMDADLILMDKEYNIKKVIINGNIYK